MTNWTFPSLRPDGITLIAGLGETGVAAARWCLRQGVRVRILDTRSSPAGLDQVRSSCDAGHIELRLGAAVWSDDVLDDVHTVVLSPGLSPVSEPAKSLLAHAQERGVEVVGEIELFARALNDMASQGYTPQVVAVTGTNGKTTVSALTQQLVQADEHSVLAAGNISPAALAALDAALINQALPDVWVLELSSFQLHTTVSLRASAVVVLNVSQDHLDWHGSFDRYIAAKARLLQQGAIRIVNRDDPVVMGMVSDLEGHNTRSFGSDRPILDGDLGLEQTHDLTWLCAAGTDSQVAEASKPKRGARVTDQTTSRVRGAVTRLMPVDALQIRGRHNALNALAALALARALGLGWANMLHALRDYHGEPHRMEFVRSIAGVGFVNDSKGTNVGATVAALRGMERPVVLIAGGLAKGQDFEPLAQAAAECAKAVVLIGQDASVLASAMARADIDVALEPGMSAAVKRAFGCADDGDIVLLSPACASMDMYQSYVHRGISFVNEVNELALDKGEVA